MRSVSVATAWWALAVVLLLGVTASAEDLTRLAERKAKMPNFRDNNVVQAYARGLTVGTPMQDGDKDGGFKMPDSVNHLKVKTNSSDPYKNEKNVTMNLNIPASVSDFLLEEIDLKYVKRPRKKSAGNKKSNSLLIKYFTNRSSNLHLSSVTKEEEPLPDLYSHGDMKERRDESPAQGSSNQVPVRPFRYKQKYPLRLLEKIRDGTIRRIKERGGKAVVGNGGTEENVFGVTRPRRSSLEWNDGTLGEEDLKALESILVSKTLVKASFEDGNDAPPTSEDDDVSIPQLYDIFEKAVDETVSEEHKDEHEIIKDDQETNKDKHEKANTAMTTPQTMEEILDDATPQKKGNWFTRTLPSYFLSVFPNSFRSSMFAGSNFLARRRRSAPYEDDYKNGNEMTVTGSISNINGIPGTSDIFRQKSPYLPAKRFSDPRLWLEQSNRVMWGHSEQLEPNELQRPQDNDVPRRPIGFSLPQSQPDPLSFDDVPSLWMSGSTDTPSYHLQSLGHPTHSHGEGNDLIESFRPGNSGSSKRLSKMDYYFSTLKMAEEYCRQRALCEVAHEPKTYAPLADMFAQETSVDGDLRTLGRELLGTRDGARLYGYIEATRRGTDRSPHACEVYRIRCHVSTRDVIDTNSLAMWREIASWLTVKVLASSSSTRDRH